MYMPINGFTNIVNNVFRAPKLQELDISFTSISNLDFLEWCPELKKLILKGCVALISNDVSLNRYVKQLRVLDISNCLFMRPTIELETIVMGLPQLQEFYAYEMPITLPSLSRILHARAFNNLQVLGGNCDHGHRRWEYVSLIVGSYPDFVLILKEFEDDLSSVVSYPSGSDTE
jgi:hypothetical protein